VNLAAHLAGTWEVRRELRDAGRTGSFAGVAEFTADGGGLRWAETGRARFGDHEGEARRTLAIVPDGERWRVDFDDGRTFHDLDLRTGRWAAAHDCGADRYEGLYVLETADRLVVGWRVTGPAKDQRIETRYRRLTTRTGTSATPGAS
jgi:Family of unknown function (DUF6314)